MPAPMFYIYANGVDVTSNFAGIGVSMTITDGVGLKSDSLQIVIDDIEGSVEAPKTGAILNPVGGYEGYMRDFGQFAVDSVVYNGWPQTITISAKSVAAKSLAKQREPKAFPTKDYPTYGHIFSYVASKLSLTLKMDPDLKSLENPYEAQAEEDGLQFLTRIGDKINAGVTVKDSHLVVVDMGEGKSASGKELDRIIVSHGYNLLSYSVTEGDNNKYGKVKSTYYDRKKNKHEKVEVETGLDGPEFLLRKPYQTKKEAEQAAKSHKKKIARSQSSAQFEIDGDPFAMAEQLVEVHGCRSMVDGVWRAKTVTHQFSSSGPYSTSLDCEKPSSSKSVKSKDGKPKTKRGVGGGRGSSGTGGASSSGGWQETGIPSLTGDSGSTVA